MCVCLLSPSFSHAAGFLWVNSLFGTKKISRIARPLCRCGNRTHWTSVQRKDVVEKTEAKQSREKLNTVVRVDWMSVSRGEADHKAYYLQLPHSHTVPCRRQRVLTHILPSLKLVPSLRLSCLDEDIYSHAVHCLPSCPRHQTRVHPTVNPPPPALYS